MSASLLSLTTFASNPWHDYREEFAVSETASLGGAVKDSSKGILIGEYAEKAGRRLYEIDTLGNRTDYKYNKYGQLASLVSDGEIKTAFRYDKNGRLDSTVDPLGRVYKNIYGKDGRLEATLNPLNEKSSFDYNEFGRLSAKSGAGGYDLSYTYTSFGEIASYTDGNGSKTKFEYDNAGRLVKRIWPDGSIVSYSYNDKGLLAKKTESDRITGYSYDNMNRLLEIKIERNKVSQSQGFPARIQRRHAGARREISITFFLQPIKLISYPMNPARSNLPTTTGAEYYPK